VKLNIVLLAGGVGTRLWPLSNNYCPKQFIYLPSIKSSSFQLAIKRSIAIASQVIIVTNNKYQFLVQQQIKDLGLELNNFQILLEKESNNTADATYYACEFIINNLNDDLTYFWPTDHVILESSNFFSNQEIDEFKINLFGQQSFNLCSSFGYIVQGEPVFNDYYQVLRFIEKPDLEKIEDLEQKFSGKIYRNLGVYLAKPSVLSNEFNSMYKNSAWLNLPIDKAIFERSQLLNFKPINFYWNDIGSIDSLYNHCNNIEIKNININHSDISEFNDKNTKFRLNVAEGRIEIIRI
jgi:mannose-1-phosphate guanylyltransferase/mannose-6-phosphate isomerase